VRLLVPTDDPPSTSARVSGHFGRAAYFAVVDTETGDVAPLAGPEAHHKCRSLAATLAEAGVDGVACTSLGPGALASLTAAGIPVYVTRERSIADLAATCRTGQLLPAGQADTCPSHGSGQCGE
jgi:predicted Fe-Mo cluster-binding NifX family protein